ncbi:MAG: condensation domain-containing protein [Luteimonas sp.]
MTIIVESGNGHSATPSSSAPAGVQAMTRPLLLLERTMYRDGRTPFTVVCTLKIAGVLDEARLRHALARVQAKHPLLRCLIQDNGSGPCFVLQQRPAPIPLRIVERTDDEQWQAEVRREWVAPFDAPDPLLRMAWLRGNETSELMLVAHHCICDGQSGFNFLRECLSAYDRPELDLGSYASLGALEDLVPATLLQDRGFLRRVRWKMRLLRLVLFIKRRSEGKASGSRITHEQMYFLRWSVDKTASSALNARCKAEHVTVMAAAAVAFMQAFRDVRGAAALTNAYAMVNVRRFLPQSRPDAMFGMAAGVPLRIKGLPPPMQLAADTFWSRAQAVRTDLTRRVDRLGAGLYHYLVGLEGMHEKYARLVADTDSAPAVRHITIASHDIVRMPREHVGFRIETIQTLAVMVAPTPANTVMIWRYDGQLEFAIVSDEVSLPRAQAQAVKERAMEILRACT